MRENDKLKLHFINVNHGDATIIELPDYASQAHFAVVDFGAKLAEDRAMPREYMKALLELRRANDDHFNYVIDFVCVTHPHDDHYGGLNRFMNYFADPNNENKIRSFWDCGFRTTATNYNRALDRVRSNDNLTFIRVAAGSEFEFGKVRVTVLAPSVDLRNRFDTYGIGMNDSSIVLKIKYKNSYIILAGDAEFASWGKTTEEFPRKSEIRFSDDALGLSQRDERAEQLGCNLLRMSHHGSKHGTSLEYLERLKPKNVVISAGSEEWYETYESRWKGKFPHPLTVQTLGVLDSSIDPFITGNKGNLIFTYSGGWSYSSVRSFLEKPGSPNFVNVLNANW